MGAKERYELKLCANGFYYLYDYNELVINGGYIDFDKFNKESAEEIVDLLNNQEQEIKTLETRNNRQYDSLKKISDLMYARDWKALEGIVEDWEESDRLLQEIHWCFEKRNQEW